MKKIIYGSLAVLALCFAACDEEDLDPKSIFATDKVNVKNDFDTWIYDNFTKPYNIEVKYRFEDKESDRTYNLVPADLDKSIALAKIVKHVWIDAYTEVMGADFLRKYAPRCYFFVGSPAYNSNGTIVLGTAEGGLKITLYYVNNLDVNDLDIASLNEYYFNTMHHEFGHILHQTINYSTDFNTITPEYTGTGWVNVSGSEALSLGYISPYASNQPDDDFVETIARYVTHDEEWWQSQLETAGDDGAKKISQKLDLVKDYLKVKWGMDLELLREVVQRRSSEIPSLDFTL